MIVKKSPLVSNQYWLLTSDMVDRRNVTYAVRIVKDLRIQNGQFSNTKVSPKEGRAFFRKYQVSEKIC